MVDIAIFNLSMKSLIKIDDGGLLDMHDHLRDMGRTIAETEKEGTRIWEATHLNALCNNTNFSRLRLNKSSPQRLEMLYSPGLRYLHLRKVHIEGMTKDTLAMIPPSLIWLRLSKCTFAIGMDRAVKSNWDGYLGNIWQLKIMEVFGCHDLDGHHISSLFSLPNIQLQHLGLSFCAGLRILPDTIGNLSQLQQLDLGECFEFEWIPDTIGNLSQLQKLNLSNCFEFFMLPDTIGNLSQLRHLNLFNCWKLNFLPDTIGNMSQLQYLNLGNSGLFILPDTIGNLSQLRFLDLSSCRFARPRRIGNPLDEHSDGVYTLPGLES